MRIFGIAGLWLAATVMLAGCAKTAPANPTPATAPQGESPFVGRYDGSGFEMAMGMEVAADGTFGWGLSVGALDMRSQGSWIERDGAIYFTTEPAPVPPAFRFLEFAPAPDTESDKLVHVFRPDGTAFTYAEANIECANGARIHEFVAGSNAYLSGYEPDECDTPVAVTVVQDIYDITSPRYDLVAMGWEEGQILRLEFAANDLGVADFTGVRGTLTDGTLTLSGGRWPMELRKLPERDVARDSPAS